MQHKASARLRLPVILTGCLVIAAFVLVYYTYPIAVREYNNRKCTEYSAVVFSAQELEEMDIFPNLKTLDLCGSDCYRDILNYMASHPQVDVTYDVSLAGERFAMDTDVLRLKDGSFTLDELLEKLVYLPELRILTLPCTTLTLEEMETIKIKFPSVSLRYTVSVLDEEVSPDITAINLSAVQPEQLDEVLETLRLLPAITEIELMDERGTSSLSLSDVKKIMDAVPNADVNYSFDLFGKTVSTFDDRLEYINQYIGNEGIEVIRQALDIMPNCTYLLLDTCGVDNEVMAQLRNDYAEQTKVVWRVWLVEEDYSSRLYLRCGSYLTDTHRIRTTYVNDKNSHVLNYCTETKYVDVGHVWQLTQCEFLAYMPDLEVCIIAITEITDITPLANHEKLEYLELFTTDISDITPLLTCPNIEHLNLSNMPYLDDISPVLTLTKLKRLRMVDSPQISYAETIQVIEALPNCKVLNLGHYATAGLWRYLDGTKTRKDERYALLCEQMEYYIDAYEYGIP